MSILSGTFTNRNIEANIRDEVHTILYGSACEPPRGHWILVMRVNLNRPCCVNKTAGKWDEPDRDCAACEGMGFFPTKVYIKSRRSYLSGDEEAGAPMIFHPDDVRYYTEHMVFSDQKQAELSKIYEIRLTEDGEIIQPVSRVVGYNIKVGTPFREDNGRIQYWALDTSKVEVN